MKTDLYIPKTIKVGYQKRQDTFTGKLAYVVYIDDKGVTRKETSWEGWRDKKIKPVEFENKPTSGYVLNKGIQRYGYHSNSGRSVIRMHDPREFEFEITVDNLVGILMNSDASKREIQGECVFAWSGQDLILLPVNSQEYKDSVQYTDKQAKNLSTKDLIKGYQYIKKKSSDVVIYMGYQHWYEPEDIMGATKLANKGKKHVFSDGKKFFLTSVTTLAECVVSECVDKFPELADKLAKSINSAPAELIQKEIKQIKPSANSYARFFKGLGTDKCEMIQVERTSVYNSKSSRQSQVYVTRYEKQNNRYIVVHDRHGYNYFSNHREPTKEALIVSQILNEYNMTQSQLINRLNELGYKELYYRREDGIEFKTL